MKSRNRLRRTSLTDFMTSSDEEILPIIKEAFVGGSDPPDLAELQSVAVVIWNEEAVGIGYRLGSHLVFPLHIFMMQDGFERKTFTNFQVTWSGAKATVRVKKIVDITAPDGTEDGWVVTEIPRELVNMKSLKHHGDPTKTPRGFLWTVRDGKQTLVPVQLAWRAEITYHDANTQPGDSGAPITDGKGHVLTVHHGYAQNKGMNLGIQPIQTTLVHATDPQMSQMVQQIASMQKVIEDLMQQQRIADDDDYEDDCDEVLPEGKPRAKRPNVNKPRRQAQVKQRRAGVQTRSMRQHRAQLHSGLPRQTRAIWSAEEYDSLIKEKGHEEVCRMARKYLVDYPQMYCSDHEDGDDDDDDQIQEEYEGKVSLVQTRVMNDGHTSIRRDEDRTAPDNVKYDKKIVAALEDTARKLETFKDERDGQHTGVAMTARMSGPEQVVPGPSDVNITRYINRQLKDKQMRDFQQVVSDFANQMAQWQQNAQPTLQSPGDSADDEEDDDQSVPEVSKESKRAAPKKKKTVWKVPKEKRSMTPCPDYSGGIGKCENKDCQHYHIRLPKNLQNQLTS